jgi:hypothetical protein
MLMRINGKLEEVNINSFVTDEEYYRYIMNLFKNYLNKQ